MHAMIRFGTSVRRSRACVLIWAVAIGVLAAVMPHHVRAQAQPRNAVASECLAMAQRLPNARYASLDAPQFLPVAARPAVTISYAGHSTYVIDTPGGIRIATDYSGHYHVPGKLPDVATMNRAHSTHYTLNPDPRIRHVLHGWAQQRPGETLSHRR